MSDAGLKGPDRKFHRVLIVAYYFPPMGLSGVQRTAKFAKYLPAFGWKPTVLTVEPAGYFAYDESLLQELSSPDVTIVRTRSWDPTRLFDRKKTVRMPDGGGRSALNLLSQLLFVPDNKIGWKRHAVGAGRRLLQEQPFDAIFSTAPPYTCHLIGMELSREFDVPLVTDFRDDWLGNPLHVYPTPYHRKKHRRLEHEVLMQSSHVTTINRRIKEALIRRNFSSREGYQAVSILPQGFDPEDFQPAGGAPPGARMTFLYSGIFYGTRTPDCFLRGLAGLLERRPELRGRLRASFAGLLPKASAALATKLGLGEVVHHQGYLPHRDAVRQLVEADVLWMTIGRQAGAELISTGKLYEYFGARKPILGLVPEGAARQALEQYGAGIVAEPDDVDAVSRALEALYDRWAAGTLPAPDEAFVERYDRKQLTGELARILQSVLVPG